MPSLIETQCYQLNTVVLINDGFSEANRMEQISALQCVGFDGLLRAYHPFSGLYIRSQSFVVFNIVIPHPFSEPAETALPNQDLFGDDFLVFILPLHMKII